MLCLAALLPSTANGQATDREVFVMAYEGHGPEVRRFEIEGSFPGGRPPFVLRVTFQNERPLVEFSRGAQRVRVLLSDRRFANVPVSRIVVATRSPSRTDDQVVVSIPYGEPQEACFINGNEVFQTISLSINDNGLAGIDELRFRHCNGTYSTPAYSEEGGVAVVRGR